METGQIGIMSLASESIENIEGRKEISPANVISVKYFLLHGMGNGH
jgi:hypothetical protein